ncbi:prophage endopeptidase tail family protein [Loigolactobacillus backii]|uniref:prophage endopeptidase tail family protein n=1 Tax=Loigolactobacillus backii TaxID=375175 RepID=UPI0022FDAC1C|nr:prophage endopeptidase tail family protein [Loigolactobacillus backii]MDA5386531.1 phage tail protein [Loigolactobacillus backii]MDA5389058.1 phage tail protein [Loigolactobacillus backii]
MATSPLIQGGTQYRLPAQLILILLLVSRLFILLKILVKGLNSADKEPLNCVLFNSFQVQWEKNSTYQLQFTVWDDKSEAYEMLDVESSVFFDGQEYIVKTNEPDIIGGIETKQMTCMQIYNEVSRVRQRNTNTGDKTYSVMDVLNFYFKGNTYGFTYQVIGTFDNQVITDLGNSDGKDCLSKILDTWPTAIIFPDNKNIRVYSDDAFKQNLGNRLDYPNNSNEVKLTYDSQTIVNQVKAFGKTKDNDSDDGNTNTTSYYFNPITVSDDDSISKWGLHIGDDISDERFTDANSMQAYAKTQLQPDPDLTIEVIATENIRPVAGEMRRLEVRNKGYVTNVQTVSYTWYPFDPSQGTDIVMNNTEQTILDYQRSTRNEINKAIAASKAGSNNYTANILLGEKVGEIGAD